MCLAEAETKNSRFKPIIVIVRACHTAEGVTILFQWSGLIINRHFCHNLHFVGVVES